MHTYGYTYYIKFIYILYKYILYNTYYITVYMKNKNVQENYNSL